jgi:hypothetical protein
MKPVKRIVWQGLNWPGSEYCRLAEVEAGWQLEGTVLAAVDGQPARIHYQVQCDRAWQTRLAQVEMELGAAGQSLRLTVDAQQRWRLDDQELAAIAGCLDVDLGFSPTTNTLPIRRLGLSIGQSAPVTAAWVRFPSLEIRPLEQRYTRLAANRYRYESGGGSFVAELEVDELGLVVDYPAGWKRLASL